MNYSRYTFFLFFIFSYITNASSLTDQLQLETADMKVIAERILNDLKAAKGILPSEPPSIEVKTFGGGIKIAQMVYDQKRIELDVRTFNICERVAAGRDNALAFIIGHELGHYLKAHKQVNHHTTNPSVNQGFAVMSPNANPVMRANFSNAIKSYRGTFEEAEADLEGAFLGYLAGYETGPAGEELLRKVYADSQMGLSETGAGYPSREERVNIVRQTTAELAELTPLFETAKYLTAIGRYAQAISFLEKVASKFESRGIYNNLGALHVLHFLDQLPNPKMITDFEFPVAFDSDFRAPDHKDERVATMGIASPSYPWVFIDPCNISFLQQQLERPREYLRKAINLDKKYATAHLNLSIVECIYAVLFTTGNECVEAKRMEFSRALSSAYSAITESDKLLKGHYIEYFDFAPSIDKKAISIPKNWEYFEDSAAQYPYYREVFSDKDISHAGVPYPEKRTTLYTRWGPDSLDIPQARRLLSNAYVQLDIVRILSGQELPNNKILAFSKNAIEVPTVPFSRGKEMDQKNNIAIYNFNIAHANPQVAGVSTNSNSSTTPSSNFIITLDSKNVREIQGGIARSQWRDEVLIDTSRFDSHFKKEENGSIFLPGVSYSNQNVRTTFKRTDSDLFQIYSNETLPYGEDLRKEFSMFLIPHSFDSINVQENMTISKGMALSEVQTLMGSYDKSLHVSTGSLLSYQTFSEKNNYQKLQNDASDAQGERINIPFRGAVIKIAPEVPITPSTRIDASEELGYGIILDIDKSNKVQGWVLYHTRVKTGALEIPNG